MKKFSVDGKTELKDFLALSLNISKKKAKNIVDSKNVFVNHKRVWISSYLLKAGDVVEAVYSDQEKPVDIKILFEDDFIIAIDKPALIISESDPGSMESLLRKARNDNNIVAIHRLDKETSGALLFAKNNSVFEAFKQMWSAKEVQKVYLAISFTEAIFREKIIDHSIDGKSAVSHVQVINKKRGFTYFRIRIETGRKYQIRKHLNFIRHPIVGDKFIGMKVIENPYIKNVKRQMLHASTLSFNHPYTKSLLTIESPLPPDMVSVLKGLGLI